MKQKTIKLSIVILVLSIVLINGCKKEDMPSKTVKVSQPTINLNGAPVIILHVGDTYTDLGATYYDSLYGDNGSLSTTTVVNTSAEGFFIVTYRAKNKYGFEGSGTRLVAVTEVGDSLNVAGNYARVSNGVAATVTKVGRGVFLTANVGGNSGQDPAYFMFTSDSTMVMPTQFLPKSIVTVNFVNPVYDFTTTPLKYSYAIDGSGFSTVVRVFEKH